MKNLILRAFNLFTIACEIGMIDALFAADIAIMSVQSLVTKLLVVCL